MPEAGRSRRSVQEGCCIENSLRNTSAHSLTAWTHRNRRIHRILCHFFESLYSVLHTNRSFFRINLWMIHSKMLNISEEHGKIGPSLWAARGAARGGDGGPKRHRAAGAGGGDPGTHTPARPPTCLVAWLPGCLVWLVCVPACLLAAA